MITNMPTTPVMFGDPRLPQRFWSKIAVNPITGCWEWQRSRFKDGYAQFSTKIDTGSGRKNWRAHRYAYTHLVGPIPDGFDLDHRCEVRHCVNPNTGHACNPCTPTVNLLLAITSPATANRAKTHCGVCGGPYETKTVRGRDERFCRPCMRAHWRKFAAKRRAERRNGGRKPE